MNFFKRLKNTGSYPLNRSLVQCNPVLRPPRYYNHIVSPSYSTILKTTLMQPPCYYDQDGGRIDRVQL